MTAYQQDTLDDIIDDVGRIVRPNPSVYLDERAITHNAHSKARGLVSTAETLHDGLAMVAYTLQRLQSEYPDPDEFRRAARFANRFLYPVFSDRYIHAEPRQRAAAITLARSFLPLLALSRDDVPSERDINESVWILAPAMLLLPMHERIPEDDVSRFDSLIRRDDRAFRDYLHNYRNALHNTLLETLQQPFGELTADGLTEFVSRVRQREEILQVLLEANTDPQMTVHTVEPLWSLYFLHLLSFPHETHRALLKATVQQMVSWDPPSVAKAFYGARKGLFQLSWEHAIDESTEDRLAQMFKRLVFPVLGTQVPKETSAHGRIFDILSHFYGIEPYTAVGLFAGERVLAGDPPPYLHQLEQMYRERLADVLCRDLLRTIPPPLTTMFSLRYNWGMQTQRECWCRYPQVVVSHDRYPYACAVCGGVVRRIGRYGHDWRAVPSSGRARRRRRGFWAEVLPVIGRLALYGLAILYLIALMVFIAAVGEP